MRPWPLARGTRLLAWGCSSLVVALLACLGASPARAQFDSLGSGAGWFDCNEDGWLDLCLLSPQGNLALFLYDPAQERFVDESGMFPVVLQGVAPGTGVACGDLNNDGFSDLFLTYGPDNLRHGGANQLLLNRGASSFQQVSRTAGILPGPQGEALSASAAIFDYDMDGRLDIYVTNYGDPIYANDGWSNQLFHNDGIDEEGIPHFTDVAVALGVDRGRSNWSLGVATADYDNDGDIDLYVANDYDGIDPQDGFLRDGYDTLYRNEGNGTFADVSAASGADDPGWAMGVVFGDYDRDGWLDLFISNFWEDTLLRNNQDGTFSNVTAAVGLPVTRAPYSDPPCTVCNGWGTAFFDYDNDGDLDLHVANGYITNSEGQSLEEPDQLFENLGPGQLGHFQEVGVAAGVADIGDARGAAYGDMNHDGFVDILVMNNQFFPASEPIAARRLLVNQGNGTFQDLGVSYEIRTTPPDGPTLPARKNLAGNHWIQVRAVGVQSNRSGIGSRITVEAGGKTWIQEVGTSSYCSSNSPFLHFGLGPVSSIGRVKVKFPSGIEVVKNGPALDAFLTIAEDDPTPVRLLSFSGLDRPEGVLVRWELAGDGEVSSVLLLREVNGSVVSLGTFPALGDENGEVLDAEAPRDAVLLYHLDGLRRDGSRERLGSVSVRRGTAPLLLLGQNRPNPFLLTTSIPISGDAREFGGMEILDVSGRIVRSFPTSALQEGGVVWDGHDSRGRMVPAGAYFYRMVGSPSVLRMVRMR